MNKSDRLMSLDALRGADMLFIMGLSGLLISLCKAFGYPDCAIVTHMRHVSWHGLVQHDTIFPLFLFIAGVAFPYSYTSQISKNIPKWKILLRILKRAVLLILLGAVYNGMLKNGFDNLRWASVLGRIGLAWGISAILYVFLGLKTRIATAIAILAGYGFLLALVPAPDAPAGADPYSLKGCIVGWFDRQFLPGKLAGRTFDPEGLLSTLPAVVTAMLGVFCGELVRSGRAWLTGNRKTLLMIAIAIVLGIAAALLTPVCPINKKLWTSTFVLAVGSYSFAIFAIFYWIVDVKLWRGWTFPLRVVGMNAITIYLLQSIVGFGRASSFLFGGLAKAVPNTFSGVVSSVGYMVVCWSVLWFLYRKNTFLKV